MDCGCGFCSLDPGCLASGDGFKCFLGVCFEQLTGSGQSSCKGGFVGETGHIKCENLGKGFLSPWGMESPQDLLN